MEWRSKIINYYYNIITYVFTILFLLADRDVPHRTYPILLYDSERIVIFVLYRIINYNIIIVRFMSRNSERLSVYIYLRGVSF